MAGRASAGSESRFEQYHDSPAAAIDGARLHEGENLVALHEPMPDMVLEYRLTVPGAQTFAVDDAGASNSAPPAFEQEFGQFQLRFDPGQPMQIQFRLGYPFTPMQAPQRLP